MGNVDSGGDQCEQTDAVTGNCLLTITHGSWAQNDGTQIQLVRRSDGTTFVPPYGQLASFDGSFAYYDGQEMRFKDGSTARIFLDTNSVWTQTLADNNGNTIQCTLASKGSLAGCIDTLGRAITVTSDAFWQLPQTLTYIDSGGASRSISFQYGTFTLKYPFGAANQYCNWGSPNPISAPLLTGVTLANGLSYQFQYLINADGTTTGEVAKIILPTGGYIRYVYDFAPISNDANLNACGFIGMIAQDRIVTNRVVSPDGTAASEQVWSYSVTTPTQLIDGRASIVMTVRDPLGNSQKYARDISGWPLVHHIDYLDASGKILKSIIGQVEEGSYGGSQEPYFYFQAFNNPRYSSLTTILPDTNQQSKVTFSYGTYNNVIEKDETDWGAGAPGAVIRKRSFGYLHDSNSAYAAPTVHILDRATSQNVCDAGSTFCSQTTTSYDTGTLTSTTNIIQHDYTSYSVANTLRGNPTQVSRFLNTTGGSVTTSSSYNDVGNLLQVTDPRSNVTTYSYADNYANGTPAQPTSAYPTLITLPTTNGVNHKQRFQYYFNTGLTSASCGENLPSATACVTGLTGQPDYKSFTYDLQGRPVGLTSGDGGQTTYTYNEAALPINIATSTKIDGTHNLTHTTVYDGLGRPSQTQLTSDPSGTDYQFTTYDSDGRTSRVYNPTRCNPPDTNCGEATWGYTSFTYDGLGRTTVVTAQDGGTTTSAFSGNTVTITDPSGKQRRSVSDALGRLLEIDEPHIGSLPTQNNHVTLQSDGNFVLYNSANSTLWATGTSGTGIGPVEVQDDGNLVLYKFIWQAGTYRPWNGGIVPYDSCRVGDSLFAGQILFQGQCLENTTNTTFALMDNGNLEIYDRQLGQITFQSFTWGNTGAYLVMQNDGNLVIYSVSGVALWASGTNGSGANVATLENDGRLILYSTVWSAGTSQGQVSGSLTHPPCDIGYAIGSTGVVGTGQCVVSRNGHFELLLQTDGNMVLYDLAQNPAAALWSTSTAVTPVSPGIGMPTLYFYDALGNLLCVEQHGDVAPGSPNATGCSAPPSSDPTSVWRVRRFTYDTLSRLVSSSNPESNTALVSGTPTRVPATYSYDPNGNLLQKTSPAPNQTGTATQTVSFCYDALNRVTGKKYAAQNCPLTSPVASYSYDQTSFNGLTIANGIGRRTGMTDQAGTEAWSYDLNGRPAADKRTISSINKTTSYVYNLIGSPTSVAYPSGRTITYTYNTAVQALSAADTPNSINYATLAAYSPAGALASLKNGTNLTSKLFYNNRMQPCRTFVTTGTTNPANCPDNSQTGNILDFTYSFSLGAGDNGNLTQITNNRDSARTQSFTYDLLNRIATAQTTSTTGAKCFGESFGIDAWGNLTNIGGLTGYSGCTQENLSVTANAQNQINTSGYDAAGNALVTGYTYDAENHLVTAGGVTYTYDGTGKRVKKSNGKIYWYGMGSDVLDETDSAGNTNNATFSEYVFFGGKRVARRNSSNTVFYYFSDHLGTSRVIVQSGQIAPCYDADFYPYGGERTPVANTCPQNYKFTGKERDAESGLDYFGARLYANQWGRFIQPDPSPLGIAIGDPQSWDLYSYVHNRPLNAVDKHGNWKTELHADWVRLALNGFLSAGEINRLANRQYIADSKPNQTPSKSYTHAMRDGTNKNETLEEAKDRIWNHVRQKLKEATTNNGKLTPAQLDSLGDAIHTLQDSTSPMHTDRNSNPISWTGAYDEGYRHIQGEGTPAADWHGFGQAIRLTLAALLEVDAVGAAAKGLTYDNVDAVADERISRAVHEYFYFHGINNPTEEGRARACALGNQAACQPHPTN
ncbi:MAG TPA: RHS repeat-associated core domain-containing protein [Candidatus Angelobacter sp.]